MDSLMNSAVALVRSVDWGNPGVYIALVLFWLLATGRWGLLLVGIVTIALGHAAHDLIVMNIRTTETIIGVPLIVYCTGGALAVVGGGVAFVRYMLA